MKDLSISLGDMSLKPKTEKEGWESPELNQSAQYASNKSEYLMKQYNLSDRFKTKAIEINDNNDNKIADSYAIMITKRKDNKTSNKNSDFEQKSQFMFYVFLEFYLYHLLYFFMLGPLIIIITPISGIHLLRNMFFIGTSSFVIAQCFQYFMVTASYLLYYLFYTPDIHYIELYMITIALVIRFSTIALKYATSPPEYIHKIRTRCLTKEELFKQTILFGWKTQSDDIIIKEINKGLILKNIDPSFFYFSFSEKINPELKSFLIFDTSPAITEDIYDPRSNELTIKNEMLNKDDQVIENTKEKAIMEKTIEMENIQNKELTIKTRKQRISTTRRGNSHKQSRSRINSSNETTTSKWKGFIFRNGYTRVSLSKCNQLLGYNLIMHMIQNSRSIVVKFEIFIAVSISIIRAFIPVFYRLCESEPPFGSGFIEPIIIVLSIAINTLFFGLNYTIIFRNLIDLKRKLYLMNQLSILLSPNLSSDSSNQYPSIDFLDIISIKTWSDIRKICMIYGDKYQKRNVFNITIYFVIYSIIVILLALHFLKLSSIYFDLLVLLIFGFESLAILGVFGYMIVLGAELNDYYRIHRDLLKEKKTMIINLISMQHLYFCDNPIAPADPFYKNSINRLKKIFRSDKKYKKNLNNHLNHLKCMLDAQIEDLNHEESNNPYKILGFTINYLIIKSLAMGLISLTIALMRSILFQSGDSLHQ